MNSRCLRITLRSLKRSAKDRPQGYLQAVLTAPGVTHDDEWVSIPMPVHRELCAHYAAFRSGIGDAVAFVAKPIAWTADMLVGTNLLNCPACEERRIELNSMTLSER